MPHTRHIITESRNETRHLELPDEKGPKSQVEEKLSPKSYFKSNILDRRPLGLVVFPRLFGPFSLRAITAAGQFFASFFADPKNEELMLVLKPFIMFLRSK